MPCKYLQGIFFYCVVTMTKYLLFLVCALFILPLQVLAAPPQGELDALTRPHAGRIVHSSSYDRSGGNADLRPIEARQTLTILDYQGAGTIRRWWLTVAPFNNTPLQRQLIIRCYWDNETTPSVEVPLGDFFGVGFGQYHQYISPPLNMTSGGYNCYWAMPFRRHARITVENRSTRRVDALYYNLDIETAKPPTPLLYFHAQFRRTQPTPGQSVTILNATGRGHYVGTVLSMQSLRGRNFGFLEGDERVFVDGEKSPSIIGTGTEDYFSSGWYFNTGVYAAPYHGLTIKDDERARISAYRWHIPDPIPFEKSLNFTIEHGAENNATRSDYSSVAFWYQTHPRAPFPPLPADLLPSEASPVPRTPGLIEAEALKARDENGGSIGAPKVEAQDMGSYDGDWSDLKQLFCKADAIGQRILLPLNVEKAGSYELIGYFTRAKDYGDVRLKINERALEPIVRGYAEKVSRSAAISFGRVELKAGINLIELEIVGRDARSMGYYIGIDGFLLKP